MLFENVTYMVFKLRMPWHYTGKRKGIKIINTTQDYYDFDLSEKQPIFNSEAWNMTQSSNLFFKYWLASAPITVQI